MPILRTLSGSNVSSVQLQGATIDATSFQQRSALSQSQAAAVTVSAQRKYHYPLSTVIIVALIAFLIGSLLRSMLSPADFVYVVSDLSDLSEHVGTGWREIRRLFEVKYIIGGWDFQVALVRRH